MNRLRRLRCLFRGGHQFQPYTTYSSLGISKMKQCRRCGLRRWYG